MTLGERIRQLRRVNHMSDDDLAQKLSVNRQLVYLWETNQALPALSELMALRQIFQISTDHLLGNSEPAAPIRKHLSSMKVVLLALFILTFFCLPAAMCLVAIFLGTDPAPVPTENMWMFFLLLPIPLASIVLGVRYKKKGLKTIKNIVSGSIFSAMLILYGSFTFLFSSFFSHDYSYVQRVESTIQFALPDTGRIATQNWNIGTQSSIDSVQYYYSSDVAFSDKKDIIELKASILRSKLWRNSMSTTLLSIVPLMFSAQPKDYDYFMIYNMDQKTYNTLPDQSGNYRFLYLAYDSTNGKMKIGEYSFRVQLR